MRFHQTIDENRKELRRIAAVLSSLAGLAEQAAGRSRIICLIVLWLLRPAEVIARTCLLRVAPEAAPGPAPSPNPTDGPAAAALRLAQGLRCLAAAFAALADDGLAPWQALAAERALARTAMVPAVAAHAAVALFDTS